MATGVTRLVPVVTGWLLWSLFSWELEFGEWGKVWGGGARLREVPTLARLIASSRGCRLVSGLRGALDPPFLPPGSSSPFPENSLFRCMLAGGLFLLPAMKVPTWDMWSHLFLPMCLLPRHPHPQCEVQRLQENPGHPCPAISSAPLAALVPSEPPPGLPAFLERAPFLHLCV